MLTYTDETIGTIVIKQNGHKFRLQIRRGNCLAVIIHEGEDSDTLYNFVSNEKHLKNMQKGGAKIIYDDVVSIKLNMLYEENYTLLKYFVEEGHKVQCYYKPEKVKSK